MIVFSITRVVGSNDGEQQSALYDVRCYHRYVKGESTKF